MIDIKMDSSSTVEDQRPGGCIRVLIVDDEPCVGDLMEEMLTLLGYEVSKSSSPISALKILEKHRFNVVISDFRMPQMNGDQFYAEAIAKKPELIGRFVFLTGDLVNEETQSFLQKNRCASLEKPFQFAAVEQIIATISGAEFATSPR